MPDKNGWSKQRRFIYQTSPDERRDVDAFAQPASKFGEMFQYSNPLAGAVGFVGGHVLFPALELGAAYDRAMQEQVFNLLGMPVPHALGASGATANGKGGRGHTWCARLGAPVVEKYNGIGVRVEDSVLLTEAGLQNLSRKVPRSIEDIERLMRSKPSTTQQ